MNPQMTKYPARNSQETGVRIERVAGRVTHRMFSGGSGACPVVAFRDPLLFAFGGPPSADIQAMDDGLEHDD